MRKFIVFDSQDKILRTGSCQNSTFELQASNPGEYIMEGVADDATQKVKFDGFDEKGQPINPRVVNKTHEEIEAAKPKPAPPKKQKAHVTNEKWQKVMNRLSALEKIIR